MTKYSPLVDPWNESIDGVVLTLKQCLQGLGPPYSKAGPVQFWAQNTFAEISDRNQHFCYREIDHKDSLFTEKWYRIYQKIVGGESIERIANFSVYFQPRMENKYIEHLGIFIKSKLFGAGYHTIPVLSIERDNVTSDDIKELHTRYLFPSSKHAYSFLRGFSNLMRE